MTVGLVRFAYNGCYIMIARMVLLLSSSLLLSSVESFHINNHHNQLIHSSWNSFRLRDCRNKCHYNAHHNVANGMGYMGNNKDDTRRFDSRLNRSKQFKLFAKRAHFDERNEDNQFDATSTWDMGPPPDLPSLLLSNRIVYLGMSIVPSVSEVIIAQLLFLNFQNDKPITMYINSVGTNAPDGSAMSYDTEAFAIADTMLYIAPPIRTICVGQAHGTAAMLLSLGQKGMRCALPNASIMLNQPKSRSRGQASDVAIRAQETLVSKQAKNALLAKACGKDISVISRDSERAHYLNPHEALEYGLIDRVLDPTSIGRQVAYDDFD